MRSSVRKTRPVEHRVNRREAQNYSLAFLLESHSLIVVMVLWIIGVFLAEATGWIVGGIK